MFPMCRSIGCLSTSTARWHGRAFSTKTIRWSFLIEVYTEPASGAEPPEYGQRRDYGPDETLTVVIDNVELGSLVVHELLP
jgi:hypothetical protein